jgi:hypothetical protein
MFIEVGGTIRRTTSGKIIRLYMTDGEENLIGSKNRVVERRPKHRANRAFQKALRDGRGPWMLVEG